MNPEVDATFEATLDNELALLARDGGTNAFAALSERYMPVLKTRANRYANVVGVDTEDFVQEGMLALFKAVKSFDSSMGIQFKTYAVTCINNSMATAIKTHMKNQAQNTGISIDAVDEKKLTQSLPARQTPMLVEDMFIEQEDSALLAWHIQSLLSNFERQILKLYLRGHSYLQISELLSTSTKSVDNALQRVRRKLRPEL